MARTTTGRTKSSDDTEETQVHEEPLAIEDMRTEVKWLERRPNEDGFFKLDEPNSGPPEKEKFDRWREWAICVIRNFDRQGKPTHNELEIKSPILKDILKRVIGEYPGASFNTDRIKLTCPAKSLFHHLDELRAERKSFGPGTLERKHLDNLLGFLEEEFEEEIEGTKNLVPEGLITYSLLWTIFKPGCIVFAMYQGHRCAFRLNQTHYHCGNQPKFGITCTGVNYDGKEFGWEVQTIGIPAFVGSVRITSLTVFPLEMHPDKEHVKQALVARGQKFESLRGIKHQHYSGSTPPEPCVKIPVYHINGPVMIDAGTFNRLQPDRAVNVKRFNPGSENEVHKVSFDINDGDYNYEGSDDEACSEELFRDSTDEKRSIRLVDDHHLLCSPTLLGFALSEKKWCQFFVDMVSAPQFSDTVFDQLVLPERQKSLMRVLVEAHAKETNDFDDFIKGKGRGLIAVLHGPPGVGKTLTAEAVSHVARRPLYMVSSGELGTTYNHLEEKLTQILDVATVWKAVLLLDEADVFLEKRGSQDLCRNSLVSIFLRLLEYYQGILILTTNRVNTFDEAFQSRIHVALQYGDLDKAARKTVWENFLASIKNVDIDDAGLDALAERNYNGRQIKNCIRTAKTLADREGQPLSLEQIETVLQIQQEFAGVFGGGDSK